MVSEKIQCVPRNLNDKPAWVVNKHDGGVVLSQSVCLSPTSDGQVVLFNGGADVVVLSRGLVNQIVNIVVSTREHPLIEALKAAARQQGEQHVPE